MHDDELTPHEIDALRALPREARPSDLLEERTLRALAERGWVRRRRGLPAPLAWSAAAAACVVFFVAGFTLGQTRGTAGSGNEARPTALPTTMAESETLHDQDSTDVTLADPSAKSSSRVQHVVWF